MPTSNERVLERLLAEAKAVRRDFDKALQHLSDEYYRSGERTPHRSAVDSYQSFMEEIDSGETYKGPGRRPPAKIKLNLMDIARRITMLIPSIKNALLVRSIHSEEGRRILSGFRGLAVVNSTREILLSDPDRASENLATIVELLQLALNRPNPDRPRKNELGRALRKARDAAGHSQEKAAEIIGTDRKAISEFESGKRKPRPGLASAIRDYIQKSRIPST